MTSTSYKEPSANSLQDNLNLTPNKGLIKEILYNKSCFLGLDGHSNGVDVQVNLAFINVTVPFFILILDAGFVQRFKIR